MASLSGYQARQRALRCSRGEIVQIARKRWARCNGLTIGEQGGVVEALAEKCVASAVLITQTAFRLAHSIKLQQDETCLRTRCGTTPPNWSPGLPLDHTASSSGGSIASTGNSVFSCRLAVLALASTACLLLEAPRVPGVATGRYSSPPVASLPPPPNTTPTHESYQNGSRQDASLHRELFRQLGVVVHAGNGTAARRLRHGSTLQWHGQADSPSCDCSTLSQSERHIKCQLTSCLVQTITVRPSMR